MSAKAKKKGEKILLLPGTNGWEAWKGVNGGGLSLALRTDEHRALDVDGVPNGELSMAFPVRDVTALPFRAPTNDDALISDLAEMHVERLGMRPGIDAGILNDFFKVGSMGEESVVLPVVLAPPPEGHLPRKAPQSFDVSARCLPLPEDGIAIWKELGRWVFALPQNGQVLHFQALASTMIGQELGREIQLTYSQLQIQGLLQEAPKNAVVWFGEEDVPPTEEELLELGRGLGGTATVAPKPAPVLPSKLSQLLPADIRAERVAVRQKQQRTIIIVALVLLYVGLGAWMTMSLLDAQKEQKAAQAKLDKIKPDTEEIDVHTERWFELSPVVEDQHWPINLLQNVYRARPDGADLTLTWAEIENRLQPVEGGWERRRFITIRGRSPQLEVVTSFQRRLLTSRDFKGYDWSTPPAKDNDGVWAFDYQASIPVEEE